MREENILLVADPTAAARHVRDAVLARDRNESCRITLLVPAVPSGAGWTWDETEAREAARRRMEEAVAELRQAGIRASGALGDFSPLDAIRDELQRGTYDEIVVSTRPSTISRWLRHDLPTRAAKEFGLPVTHLTADADDRSEGGRWEPAA
jgi:hypothetical protein